MVMLFFFLMCDGTLSESVDRIGSDKKGLEGIFSLIRQKICLSSRHKLDRLMQATQKAIMQEIARINSQMPWLNYLINFYICLFYFDWDILTTALTVSVKNLRFM